MPMGTPMLVKEAAFDAARSGEGQDMLHALVLYPPNAGSRGPVHDALPASILVKSNLAPIHRNHRLSRVDLMRPEYTGEAREDIQNRGAITFLSEGEGIQRRTMRRAIEHLVEDFRYSLLYSVNSRANTLGKGDTLINVLNLYNLKYVLPIFDPRNVDGLALEYVATTRDFIRKTNTIRDMFRCCLVLSNRTENLFFIDGVKHGNPGRFNQTQLASLLEWMRNPVERVGEKTETEKQKKARKKPSLSSKRKSYGDQEVVIRVDPADAQKLTFFSQDEAVSSEDVEPPSDPGNSYAGYNFNTSASYYWTTTSTNNSSG